METARPVAASTFEQLLEAMPDAVVIAGMDGRIVRVNQRAAELSGYARDDLVGMAVEELVPEGLRERHAGHRAAYQLAPRPRSMGVHMNIRCRRRDGSEFPADIALGPMVTEEGPLVVVSMRDVTERREAAAELVQAQERFRLVGECVHEYAIFMLDGEGFIRSWSPTAHSIKGYTAEEAVGRHFSMFYPSRDVEDGKPARELEVAAQTGRYEEEGWRVRKDGGRFWASVTMSAIRDEAGTLLGFAKITRDVTERKRQDDRLRAVLEVAQATLAGRSEEELLRLIAERARALADAELGLVALVDEDHETLRIAAAAGPGADTMLGRQLPLAGTLTARVLASGEPVVVDDASAVVPDAVRMMGPGGRFGPTLVARLASRNHAFGGLSIVNDPGGRPFTAPDVELIQLFAAQAAVAIDYTRVREEVQRLAVLEDRERIGRELHDGAIQALFAVGMGLQGLAMMSGDGGLRTRLEGSVTQIDEVIRDLRGYIFGLRPGLAGDRHLGRALEELAHQLEERHGVACAVAVDPAVAARLAARSGDVVQVVREALSNVGRHAEAATCRVSLRGEPGRAVLEIEDDGRGFSPDTARPDGWGLRNLRERAAMMGGALEVRSVSGEGTTVRLTIPA